jgi:FlaA1/EpsC-like NDP-sugar epimerase
MKLIKSAAVFFVYVALAIAAYAGAFLLRYDFIVPRARIRGLLVGIAALVVIKGLVLIASRLCRSWWRMAGIPDLVQLLKANLIASFLFTAAALLVVRLNFPKQFAGYFNVPRSIYVLDFLLCFLLMAGLRLFVRLAAEFLEQSRRAKERTKILIYGAGSAGLALLKEIQTNPGLRLQVVGFIDDDRAKWNSIILGVRVLGSGRDIPRLVARASLRGANIREIVVAMPSADGRAMREAMANCRASGVPSKAVPGLGELLSGKISSAKTRTTVITELLGRPPVPLDEYRIRGALTGRTVLVSGGAGSIGAELCRQIAAFSPHSLVILDRAESDLFRIQLELRQQHPSLQIIACVGDIRDSVAMSDVMSRYSINAVFHAAAYKHVPMMEANVIEALLNNVVGTWNIARAARDHGVEIFVMISTDKAVRPSNVMGATKRAAEHMVRSIGKTALFGSYLSVRFGNVLGSNGSVVPLFEQQIATGGPVTVTHPDMRRCFMTITEAVQLVLEASALGKGREIFMLSMGEPVRISDLARNMIKQAGYEPDEDIEIRYIGTRPGEKLCEDLVPEGEHILATHHEKIKIFQAPEESTAVDAWMNELLRLLELRQERVLLEHLKRLVPEYQPTKRLLLGARNDAARSVSA